MRLVSSILLAIVVGYILLVVSVNLWIGSREQESVFELSGSSAERAAFVTRIIEYGTALPSAIEDAHFIERQIGDNILGPADYQSYIWIKVSADDIPKWTSVLKEASPYKEAGFVVPPTEPEPTWWRKQEEFHQLIKYEPLEIFHRWGWVAIDADGKIFRLHIYNIAE